VFGYQILDYMEQYIKILNLYYLKITYKNILILLLKTNENYYQKR